MSDDPIQQSPVAEPTDAAPAPSEESASQAAPPAADQSSTDIDDWIRGKALGPGPTSNPGGVVPTAEMDAADDGASASDPSGDVKPSDQPGQPKPGRRGAAARIAELEAENARLQQAFEEANPPPPDATAEAQQAIRDREARYRRLLVKPDTDVDWTNEDYDFLQSEKQRRAIVPEIQQHYETVLADDLAAHQTAYTGWVKGFQDYILTGMEAVKGLPGVDFDAIKAAPGFPERERLIYDAGKAASAAEVQRLQTELSQARRDLAGSAPRPINGGASPPSGSYDIDTWIRQKAGVA